MADIFDQVSGQVADSFGEKQPMTIPEKRKTDIFDAIELVSQPKQDVFDTVSSDIFDQVSKSQQDSALADQWKETPKSLLYGAADAGLGIFEGAERGFAQISNKLAESSRDKYQSMIDRGKDAESWNAQAFDTLGTFHEKMRDFWLGKDITGGADYIAEIREELSKKIAPQTQGFVTDVFRGLGGMATLPLDITGAGVLTISAQMFDEGYQQSTGSEEERLDKATAYAFLGSPVELAGDIMLKKFGGRATRKGLTAVFKQALKKLGLNFVSEGSTETLQDGILNKINGKRMFDENSMRTFLVSGTVGTIVSGAHVVNNEVQSSRTRGQLETMGLNEADVDTALDLIGRGKVDEANAFIANNETLKMTDIIEASQQAFAESNPLDEAQARQLETLLGKDVLTVKEQADLEMLKMELDVDDQAIIEDAINNVEGSDVVFNELITRLKQEQVEVQDDTERTETIGTEQEGRQEPVGAKQTTEGAVQEDAGAAEAEVGETRTESGQQQAQKPNETAVSGQEMGDPDTILFHGSEKLFDSSDVEFGQGILREGIYTGTERETAEQYGKNVHEYVLNNNAKTLDLSDGYDLLNYLIEQEVLNREDIDSDLENYIISGQTFQYDPYNRMGIIDDVLGQAKEDGFDVVKMADDLGGTSDNIATIVLNKDVITPRDIYDAQKQSTQVGKGAQKTTPTQPVLAEKVAPDERNTPLNQQEGTPDENAVGISRRMRKIHNEQADIDDTPLPEREEQINLLASAIELNAPTDILIDEIATKPRVLEDIEVASLTIRTAEIVDDINEMKEQLKTADDEQRDIIEVEIGRQLEYLEKIENGVSASGTKMGRALAAMNMRLIRGTYDLATSMSRARKKKGSKLTAKERKKVAKNTELVNEQEDKVKEMLGDEVKDISKAKNLTELKQRLNDYLSYLENVHREIKEQTPKKEKSALKQEEARLKLLLKRQDTVIDLINQLEGRGKKRPTKKDGKVYDPEGYVAMANNLREQIRKDAEYKRFLESERVKEQKLDDKIAETTKNVEQVKRTIEKKIDKKQPSMKQKILKKLKGIERDQDKVIELQNIFNEHIVEVSDPKFVEDPEGLKDMAKNLRKMIRESDWYKDAKANPTKARKKRIAMLEAQIDMIEGQMDGLYRDVKNKKKIEDPAIELLKDRIKFMQAEMRIADELAVINEDIRLIGEGRYLEVEEIKRRAKHNKLSDGLDAERAELQRRKDDLNRSINELSRNGAEKVVMDVADFLRAMKLSLDTWIGRQGAKTLFSDPKTALSAFGDSMAGSLSDSKFYEASRQIEDSPAVKFFRRFGLEIMEIDGTFDLHQEAMNSKLAEKFPFVRWSNRNMILGINSMRAKLAQKWLNRYPNESDAFYENVSKLINEWTGRGTLGKLEKGAHGLSAIFTAPRWVTSNWQVIANERHAWVKNPKTGRKEMDKRLLKEISTQKAKAALGFGMVASMMAALGFEFEEDPEEGDFMKMRKGDLVIDIMPGLSSNMRLLGVLAESAAARVGAGELEGRMSFPDIADRYMSYKWAPIISASRELISGETAIGDEREIEETVVLSMIPIMLESIYQDYVKDGKELERVMLSQGIQWFGFGGALYED